MRGPLEVIARRQLENPVEVEDGYLVDAVSRVANPRNPVAKLLTDTLRVVSGGVVADYDLDVGEGMADD